MGAADYSVHLIGFLAGRYPLIEGGEEGRRMPIMEAVTQSVERRRRNRRRRRKNRRASLAHSLSRLQGQGHRRNKKRGNRG